MNINIQPGYPARITSTCVHVILHTIHQLLVNNSYLYLLPGVVRSGHVQTEYTWGGRWASHGGGRAFNVDAPKSNFKLH